MDPLLVQLHDLFAEASFPWGVCGGYALELFAGRTIRPHGDIDLCLPESARAEAIAFLLERGWCIHEYRGMGRVKVILTPSDSEAGRNLMASRGSAAPVQFFPCEEEGLFYHRFTPGMEDLCFLDLLFEREAKGAFPLQDGLPVLAPEIALLYKAENPDAESSRLDFSAVYPLLDAAQTAWLQAALAAKYPQGHP